MSTPVTRFDFSSTPPDAATLGRVHFIAIGGAGMSGVARIMLARGTAVTGSDAKDSLVLRALAAEGAVVHVGHDPAHVDGVDTVVISSAIRESNVELARAGANTVCELTAVGLPAVYVPLPIGNGEQRVNAADVIAAGGGVLADDAEVTPAWVDATLLPLLADGDRLQAMAAASAGVGEREADERLAEMVRTAARTRKAPR